ncbi:putative lipoprotein [Fibrobacter succinogenes subsp. succinogenes S85]|uniref:Putative lipoprotein n=1 Tax=Fibrobacter succinogenes (strain ATCC 19169 / S85) TaxID=59374 RepID=D9S994_FIBSS|nr:putative lipoprotein [Fibrobacter succinogenes subsp. succinogenes S85]
MRADMTKFNRTNVFCLGLLGALALTACSDDPVASKSYGTTEEKKCILE